MEKRLEKKNYVEVTAEVMDLACNVSFCAALEFIHKEFGDSEYYFKILFEYLWDVDREFVRTQMYENLLEKPYIYFIKKFLGLDYEATEFEPDFEHNVLRKLYEKNNGREIYKKILEFLCEINDFHKAVGNLEETFKGFLSQRQFELIWGDLVKYYGEVLEKEGNLCEMVYVLGDFGVLHKTGYYTILEYITENFKKFIPYAEDADPESPIGEVIFKKLRRADKKRREKLEEEKARKFREKRLFGYWF